MSGNYRAVMLKIYLCLLSIFRIFVLQCMKDTIHAFLLMSTRYVERQGFPHLLRTWGDSSKFDGRGLESIQREQGGRGGGGGGLKQCC